MSKPATDDRQVIGGETGHKYFTMMLNMADDELDPHQYRLLGHYLRWAGHGGKREEGLRETAKVTRMSVDKVRAARRELITMGYLEVKEPNDEEKKQGLPAVITVVDRWAENVANYTKSDPVQILVQGVTPEPVSETAHPPVQEIVHKEELKTEEQKEEKQPAPQADAAGETNVIPFKDEKLAGSHSQKLIAEIIHAWWTALPVKPATVDPKNMYQNKTNRRYAAALLDSGVTAEHVTRYVRAQTTGRGYYRDKALKFANVADHAPAWVAANAGTFAKYVTEDGTPAEQVLAPAAGGESQSYSDTPPASRPEVADMIAQLTKEKSGNRHDRPAR